MTTKLFKAFGFALIATFIVAASSAKTTFAATDIYVGNPAVAPGTGTQADPFDTFADAYTAAVDGDTIIFDGTTENITTGTTITKAITIKGMNGGAIETSGSNQLFTITAVGVTIQDLTFTKTDKTGQHIVGVQAANATISNNSFTGQYVIGDPDVSRVVVMSPGVTGFLIDGNTISAFRQPGYFDASTGTISNNTVSGTKGWVIVADANITITGNTGSGNTVDFAIIPAGTNNYSDVAALSAANNNALVINKAFATPQLTTVYVQAGATPTPEYDTGTEQSPYTTITDGYNAVVAGGTINVKAGSYAENLTIAKSVKLVGPNQGLAGTASRLPEATLTGAILITSSDVTVSGLAITNPAWNGASVKGVHVYSDSATLNNTTISNNVISSIANANTKGSYGVMIQGVINGAELSGNKIDAISSQGWARGIEVTPTCANTTVPMNVTITGNSISNITSATNDAFLLSIDSCHSTGAVADGTSANAAQVSVTNNSFDSAKVKNDSANNLNAQSNYWGSATPDFSGNVGSISTTPYWTDAGMTTLSAPAAVSGGGGGAVDTGSSTSGTSSSGSTGTTASSSTGSTTGGEVLGASSYRFTITLKYGSKGDEVTELQKVLGDLYKGKIDGIFGPLTRAAVKAWQKQHGLVADGIVGPKTRAELNK